MRRKMSNEHAFMNWWRDLNAEVYRRSRQAEQVGFVDAKELYAMKLSARDAAARLHATRRAEFVEMD